METIGPAGNLYAKEVSFVKIIKKGGPPFRERPTLQEVYLILIKIIAFQLIVGK